MSRRNTSTQITELYIHTLIEYVSGVCLTMHVCDYSAHPQCLRHCSSVQISIAIVRTLTSTHRVEDKRLCLTEQYGLYGTVKEVIRKSTVKKRLCYAGGPCEAFAQL